MTAESTDHESQRRQVKIKAFVETNLRQRNNRRLDCGGFSEMALIPQRFVKNLFRKGIAASCPRDLIVN
jgi:hypothetical protein